MFSRITALSALSVAVTPSMNHQRLNSDFHEVRLLERYDDVVEMAFKERDQRSVGDVAGRHDQELSGTAVKYMAVSEVTVLRDNRATLTVG